MIKNGGGSLRRTILCGTELRIGRARADEKIEGFRGLLDCGKSQVGKDGYREAEVGGLGVEGDGGEEDGAGGGSAFA